MTLAKAPEELTLLEVVTAVEPIKRIRTCPLGLPGHGVELCLLHRRLDDVLATVEAAFRETTLAELLPRPRGRRRLCVFPAITPQRSRR